MKAAKEIFSLAKEILSNPTMVYEVDLQNRIQLAIKIYELELRRQEIEIKKKETYS